MFFEEKLHSQHLRGVASHPKGRSDEGAKEPACWLDVPQGRSPFPLLCSSNLSNFNIYLNHITYILTISGHIELQFISPFLWISTSDSAMSCVTRIHTTIPLPFFLFHTRNNAKILRGIPN